MNKKIIFMFSGQGSQYYQMGKELYESHPKFKWWMDHCSEIAGPSIGTSLVDVLYKSESKSRPFDKILYTNPALVSIEYSLARVLMDAGIKPNYVLGYSLGELSSALIAGAISLEDGITFVSQWGKVLEDYSSPASMLAILENVDIVSAQPELFSQCSITGRNFQSNFVVSGFPEPVAILEKSLKAKGILSVKLPVNYGFHTGLMDILDVKFKKLASNIRFQSSHVPIISAYTGGEVHKINEEHLWNVTRYPVNFEQTVLSLLALDDYCFIDVGPSGSLATFVKYLLPKNTCSIYFELMNQFGQDVKAMEKLMSCFKLAKLDFVEV